MSLVTNQAYLDGYLDNLISQRQLAALTTVSYRRDLLELITFTTASDSKATLTSVTHP